MAISRGRPHFHLAVAVASLILPYAAAVALDFHLPHDAAPTNTDAKGLPPCSISPTNEPHPQPSTLAAVPAFSDHLRAPDSPQIVSDASTIARRLLASPPAVAPRREEQAAAAPSPQAAPSPTRRAHARSATRARHLYYGVSFADLHDACLRQNCAADYFHRLATVLYGPHTGDDYDYYCVVRTIEGWQPILPGSWRAAVASGGDVCYIEVARMDDDTFRIHCWAWACSRRCTASPDEALSFAIDAISTPCGGVTRSGGVSRSAAPSVLNAALPLLAVAFLPRSVAAAVVLSYLPSLVRADLSEKEFLKLNHATCAVYPYDNNTGAIERARPVPGLREMCLRPLCLDFDGDAAKHTDPLRIYCAVHSLDGASSPSIFFPWRNTWRAHLPISDPDAAAASGEDVCYVELAHMDYRERYYISCPASDGHARLSCTEFPEEAVASAVREHRKLTYVVPNCDSYMYGAAGALFGAYDYDADL